MTDEITVANPMEMTVTSNSAPDVQQTPEMVTTDPKTDYEAEVPEVVEAPEPVIKQEDNDLARERISDKLRADEYKRQLDAVKPKDEIPESEPDINDYKTLDEYKADYKKWAKEEGKREERLANSQAEESRKTLALRANVEAKAQESRAKHADFDAIVNPIVPVIASSPILKDFLAKNAMGAEVMYELGRNPAVLDQIMRGDMWEAGERLLGIAARLKKPAAAAVSNAPEPIKTIGSRETVKPRLTELASKDINGYMAKANKAEIARKRAN